MVLWQLHPTLPPSSSSSTDWSLSKLFSQRWLLSCSRFSRLPSCPVSHLAASSSSKTELLIFSWSQPANPSDIFWSLCSLSSRKHSTMIQFFHLSSRESFCSSSFLLTRWTSGSALPRVVSYFDWPHFFGPQQDGCWQHESDYCSDVQEVSLYSETNNCDVRSTWLCLLMVCLVCFKTPLKGLPCQSPTSGPPVQTWIQIFWFDVTHNP